jgi:hypothetical protein
VPVVFDEFPYLVEQAPELPSVLRRALSPRGPAREGNALLSEEPELGDASLYHAVLAAICAGAHKRSDIARTLGRPDSALSHPLDMLERVRLLRLHHLIIRPFEARLVGRGRAQVWAGSADTVASLIYGPHLEDLGRSWCVDHASTETLGGLPGRCEPALVACREQKDQPELDVVVTSDTADRSRRCWTRSQAIRSGCRSSRNQKIKFSMSNGPWRSPPV